MRDLTIIGRNTILKSLALSKLMYPITTLYTPKEKITEIQKEILKFIWKDKTPKVKSNVMYQIIENGGLNVTDFELNCISLNLNWIKRILDPENSSKFKATLQYMIPANITDLFTSRCHINYKQYNLPLFYNQLIEYWNKYRQLHQPQTKQDIREEYLWWNDNITVERKPMYNKQMYNKGIKQIQDIVTPDGNYIKG